MQCSSTSLIKYKKNKRERETKIFRHLATGLRIIRTLICRVFQLEAVHDRTPPPVTSINSSYEKKSDPTRRNWASERRARVASLYDERSWVTSGICRFHFYSHG